MSKLSDLQQRCLQCQRCGHAWLRRKPELPKMCPRCHSLIWNRRDWRKDLQQQMEEIRERDAES